MNIEMTKFQAVAANLSVEGEVCDLLLAGGFSAETRTAPQIAPIIQKLAATSIAEIDRLIAELQEAKDHLQSERERIEREMFRYTDLSQMALDTAKVISEAVSQWHPARNGQRTNAPQ